MGWQEVLDKLVAAVPPPADPFHAPVDWEAFEAANGFRPPSTAPWRGRT
jgi:hypothetical protein